MVTLYISEQQRASAEKEEKARLTLQYTEFFLTHYRDINDSNVRQVLYAATGTMRELGLPGGGEFYNLISARDQIVSESSKPITEYREQGKISRRKYDCSDRNWCQGVLLPWIEYEADQGDCNLESAIEKLLPTKDYPKYHSW